MCFQHVFLFYIHLRNDDWEWWWMLIAFAPNLRVCNKLLHDSNNTCISLELHCCKYYTHFHILLKFVILTCASICLVYIFFTVFCDHVFLMSLTIDYNVKWFLKIVLKSCLDLPISLLNLKGKILLLLLDSVPTRTCATVCHIMADYFATYISYELLSRKILIY